MKWDCREFHDKLHFTVFLSEDIYLESFDLIFGESFTTYIKDFSVYTSLSDSEKDWESVGYFKCENGKKKQSFVSSKPRLGRYIRFDVHSIHNSNFFYCTLTQVLVYGRTFLDYTTQKTKDRIDKEVQVINDKFKEIEKEKEDLMAYQPSLYITSSPSSFEYSIKRSLESQQDNSKKQSNLMCTMIDYFKQTLHGFSWNILDESQSLGPIESYFEILSIKLNVDSYYYRNSSLII